MSEFGNRYKSEMDRRCAEDISLSAEDILAKAGVAKVTSLSSDASGSPFSRTNNRSKVKAKNQRILRPLIGIAAALFLLFGVGGFVIAGMLGYGPAKNIFEEETQYPTETVVEAPCLYEMGTTHEIEGFDVTFEGLTGNQEQPGLLFTFKTDDEEFCSGNKSFDVTYYSCLTEDDYDTRRQDLFKLHSEELIQHEHATAIQDPADQHLYHTILHSKHENMVDDQTFVVAIRSIRIGQMKMTGEEGTMYSSCEKEIMFNVEWRVHIPDLSKVHMVSVRTNDGAFYYDNSEYRFIHLYTYDESPERPAEAAFRFDWFGDMDSFLASYEEIDAKLRPISKDLILNVDGTEYSCTDVYSCWETPGDLAVACFVFPSFDMSSASKVTLVYGDKTITVK